MRSRISCFVSRPFVFRKTMVELKYLTFFSLTLMACEACYSDDCYYKLLFQILLYYKIAELDVIYKLMIIKYYLPCRELGWNVR